MAPSDLDWDDLRVVLAIARGGGLAGAARRLGVNHSTVFRRLDALEAGLGVRLFERRRSGYAATPAGDDLLRTAERVESEMLELGRRIAGRDLSLSGAIRLTAPDDIATRLLIAPLARFRAAHPGIDLELVIDNRMLSLTKREADVAVRPTREPPESYVGRIAGPVATAAYMAAPAADGARDLAALPWIAWDEGGGPPDTARWLAQQAPASAIAYRSNSLLNQADACRAGLGAALLPCLLGDPDAELRRLTDPLPDLDVDLWLLTHRDLRRTARIRALLDFLFFEIKAQRPLLAGETG